MNTSNKAHSIVAILALSLVLVPAVVWGQGKVASRPAWTNSRVVGSPEPPLPFVAERAFPKIKFKNCLDMVIMPGANKFWVVEQSGKVYSIQNQQDVSKTDLVADFKKIDGVRSVYALAFHPQFARNNFIYVCYIKAPNVDDGTHVARFTFDRKAGRVDLSTERTIVTWRSGGHNGCCLKFGPEGYLYISTGDAAPANPPDIYKAGQDVSNLLSAILRVDVDRADKGRNYRIPPDNPFVKTKGARGEIWAYGFRNPWRMSFDRATGDLWVGDVGWELWEMLDRVQRGGNYGWSVMEGNQVTHPEWTRGPSPVLPPTIDHPHSESSSITDGLTYYGKRLTGLSGHHIYGDYDTGKLWSFRYQGGKVVEHREIADTTIRIVSFAEDHNGEFFLLDHPAGTIHRLVPNPQTGNPGDFPRKLSQTGLFRDVASQVPASGVLSYQINAPQWADHATATRFVAVPGKGTVSPAGGNTYSFPRDSVLVKTLSIETEKGNPRSQRKIETQILHFDGRWWQPYTYAWNEEGSDAELVGMSGKERTLDIVDAAAPKGHRQQAWRFSGRAECQRCHNKWSGPALAFNTHQLNRSITTAGKQLSQLQWLADVKLLSSPVKGDSLAKLASPYDDQGTLESRARAYLHTNCAHCHRMHAGSAVLSKMHYDLSLEKMDMVGAKPSQGSFGIHSAQVIAAGDPLRSVLLYRMAKLGGGRMPHIGSSEIDRRGVQLMHDWIKEMKASEEAGAVVRAIRKQESTTLADLKKASTKAAQSQSASRLLSSTSGAMVVLRAIHAGELDQARKGLVIQAAARHDDVRIRDLFEPFVPADQRVKRLGSVVLPQQILRLKGRVADGARVFHNTAGVSCKTCHRIGKDGREVGPDLSTIGKKNSPAQLLESILQPSKRIEPKFVTYLVETNAGRLHTGLLVQNAPNQIVLQDAKGDKVRIPKANVERLVPQRKSLMPELLLRDLTAQQVADLIAYLKSLE